MRYRGRRRDSEDVTDQKPCRRQDGGVRAEEGKETIYCQPLEEIFSGENIKLARERVKVKKRSQCSGY